MKKYLPCIAGVLLGLCFLLASVPILFNLYQPTLAPVAVMPAEHFMAAFWPTGYMKFVKTFQMRPRCDGGMSKPSGFPRKNARASKNGFKNLVFF
jgi:hypothetical protein